MFHITFHSNLKFNKKTKKEERVTINSKPSFTRNKILQEPLYFTIGRFTSTLRPFVTPDVLHSFPFFFLSFLNQNLYFTWCIDTIHSFLFSITRHSQIRRIHPTIMITYVSKISRFFELYYKFKLKRLQSMITKSNDTHRLKEVIKDPVAPVGKWWSKELLAHAEGKGDVEQRVNLFRPSADSAAL